jgi:hypothetical protein
MADRPANEHALLVSDGFKLVSIITDTLPPSKSEEDAGEITTYYLQGGRQIARCI